MCLYPRMLKNPKYRVNKKNGGRVPPISDNRVQYVPVGCGNCIECRKQKAREWQIRLAEEIKENKNGKFVTLTFSDESLKELEQVVRSRAGKKQNKLNKYIIENEIATIAIRRFLERWRRKYKKSVRHWLVTELGHENTKRIHLHGIIWTDEPTENIEERWGYGHIWVGEYVNAKTVNYIIKYVNKVDLVNKGYKSKILTSQGIGRNYMERSDWKRNRYAGEETEDTYIYTNGSKAKLPIYYRNKIYDEDEREQLWLSMLDKDERWVLGQKIDVSRGEEEYEKILRIAQTKNKRLGYGDDTKEWSITKYNKERRKLAELQELRRKENELR